MDTPVRIPNVTVSPVRISNVYEFTCEDSQ